MIASVKIHAQGHADAALVRAERPGDGRGHPGPAQLPAVPRAGRGRPGDRPRDDRTLP